MEVGVGVWGSGRVVEREDMSLGKVYLQLSSHENVLKLPSNMHNKK